MKFLKLTRLNEGNHCWISLEAIDALTPVDVMPVGTLVHLRNGDYIRVAETMQKILDIAKAGNDG